MANLRLVRLDVKIPILTEKMEQTFLTFIIHINAIFENIAKLRVTSTVNFKLVFLINGCVYTCKIMEIPFPSFVRLQVKNNNKNLLSYCFVQTINV